MTRFSLFCHRCEDGLLDVDMQVRIELSWSYGLLGEMFVHHTLHTRAGEGLLSSHEFVGDATQSILVSFPAGDTTILLWCHIRRCARMVPCWTPMVASILAMSKSASSASHLVLNRIFSGLRSRCTTFCSCTY